LAERKQKSDLYYRASRVAFKALLYALAIGLSLAFLFPVVWAFGASLKPLGEVYRYPPTFFHWPPRWENYPQALSKLPFARFIANTLVITLASTAGQVFSASLVGYAFARLRWRGREVWFVCLLATMMLPGQILLIPHYLIFKNLGWVNTYKPRFSSSSSGSSSRAFRANWRTRRGLTARASSRSTAASSFRWPSRSSSRSPS